MKIHQRNATLNMNCQKKELMNLEIEQWTLCKPKNREKKNWNRGSGKYGTRQKNTNICIMGISEREKVKGAKKITRKNG